MARRGHNLLELIVAMAVFSLLMVVVVALFKSSLDIWRRTSGADGAQRALRAARASLERELALATPTQMDRASVADHLGGGGSDGEALWFLSPIDPATGEIVRKSDGTPMWQRNILYYLVVPSNHAATFGMTCQGGAAANGYDDRCPHKALIRQVIDMAPATVPTNPATEETLIANIAPYLTQPNGYDVSGMGGPAREEVGLVTGALLTFESLPAPAPNSIPTEILLDLRALNTQEALRHARVGMDPFYDSRFTFQGAFTVFLKN